MGQVHPRVVTALDAQLDRWRAALAGGARRIGWKIGLNFPEVEQVIGRQPVIGHLTSRTLLSSGAGYAIEPGAELRAETEVALSIGRRVAPEADRDEAQAAISGVAVALELVDVKRPPDDLEGIVIANAAHRAFAVGSARAVDPSGLEARLALNGKVCESATPDDDYGETVLAVAQLLGAVGEGLRRGDRILAGSLTHVPVQPGDEVRAEIEALGALDLEIVG
jgi:2-oxo-3-hexenedioate decarboxylase